MPAEPIFLLVEGPHDAEFMARLLAPMGFEQKKEFQDIPEPYQKLIPTKFPAPDSTSITERHPVPAFYQSGQQWLILLVGQGSKAAKGLVSQLAVAAMNGFCPKAIGVVVDQDQETSPEAARDKFVGEFNIVKDSKVALNFAIPPGSVVQGTPRLGLYVLPDNKNPGALEDLLLECGEVNYKLLKDKALAYRDDALNQAQLTKDDLKKYGSQGGQRYLSKLKKAWVGAMGGILNPAVAIQNSIRENRWLAGETLTLPNIKAITDFLKALIGNRDSR